jgi:O-antigen/teichoic acid export membrane protein
LPVPILSAEPGIGYCGWSNLPDSKSPSSQMLYKAFLILSGNVAASLLLFARNLIVARLIPVGDYGVAATFAMAMGVVEMASTLGLQQQIIQAKDGDDPRFQAALQGFQLLRGAVSSLALFALAGPFARFLGLPEVVWAYQILAVVPILNALRHFDIHRLNRHMRFGPLLMTDIVPATATLALVWPLAVWFGDWQVMLWSIIAQSAIGALTSHLMAERPYRLVWDRAIMSGSLRFGWPLLVNAMLMYLVFHGDKLIVSRILGMDMLAIFAMGMTLALTPTLVMAGAVNKLFLPVLSQAARTPDFTLMAQKALQTVALSALLFVLIVLLIGGPVVHFLLGIKYADLLPLMIWLALGQALRVMKTGPTIVAMALGQTSNAMVANLVRIMGLPLAWIIVAKGGDLLDLLLISLFAEGLGLWVSLALMLSRSNLPKVRVLMQQGMIVVMLVAVAIWAWHHPSDASIASWPVWVSSGIAALIALVLLPELSRAYRRRPQK